MAPGTETSPCKQRKICLCVWTLVRLSGRSPASRFAPTSSTSHTRQAILVVVITLKMRRFYSVDPQAWINVRHRLYEEIGHLTCHLHISLPSESILIAMESRSPKPGLLQSPLDHPAKTADPSSPTAAAKSISCASVPSCPKQSTNKKGERVIGLCRVGRNVKT